MNNLLRQTVTITPRNTESTDAYNNTRLTAGTAVTTLGLAQQIDEIDARTDANQATGQWWLFLPAGTSINRADKVSVGGMTLEVIGKPRNVVQGLSGQVHHMEVKCRAVEG